MEMFTNPIRGKSKITELNFSCRERMIDSKRIGERTVKYEIKWSHYVKGFQNGAGRPLRMWTISTFSRGRAMNF